MLEPSGNPSLTPELTHWDRCKQLMIVVIIYKGFTEETFKRIHSILFKFKVQLVYGATHALQKISICDKHFGFSKVLES